MMSSLVELLDILDLAVARSRGRIPSDVIDDMEAFTRSVRTRHGFLGEALVVALAGGTGSGKSSILNALVGGHVVDTGVVRPTTQEAAAVFAPRSGLDLGPLLDALGVARRIPDDGAGRYVFVDLPDFDSTEEGHRHIVEEVIPRVDAIVWVLDPEKYADPILHDHFLAPMADHESVFLFVLNQADRLGDRADEARASLERHLLDDGFTAPWATTTIADPAAGIDVAGLRAALVDRLDDKATATTTIGLELRRIATRGWRACADVDADALGTADRDARALASATFVLLGVEAHPLGT